MKPTSVTPGSASTASRARRLKGVCRGTVVASQRQGQPRRQDLLRAEPGIDVQDAYEAHRKETGADQQDERQRDLGDDQNAARGRCRAAGRSGAPALAQQRFEISARDVKRRDRAEYQAGQRGDRHGERHDAGVDRDVGVRREASQIEPREQLQAGCADDQARTATDRRQHEALGQQLTRHPPSPGTHGEPDGQLPRAAGRPGQEQVGDVDATDEQDEQDAGLEDVERRTDESNQLILEADDPPCRSPFVR